MLMASERLDETIGMPAMAQPIVDPDVDLRYFVLFTEPMGEQRAATYLRNAGFNPWVPLFQRTMIYHVRKYGRSEPRSRRVPWPIFCGYLFLPLNRAWSFGPIDRCPYLRQSGDKFMTYHGQYKLLSTKDLVDIRQAETIANYRDSYKVGDQVMILSGPFAERMAKIAELDDVDRIALLMDIFGRETRTFASVDQIAKANQ